MPFIKIDASKFWPGFAGCIGLKKDKMYLTAVPNIDDIRQEFCQNSLRLLSLID